jgi:YD repeat-containing protein
MLIFTTSGISQTINFAYDAAGNRVSRTINLGNTKSSAIGNESEQFAFEQSEDFFTEVLAEKEIKIYPNPTRGQLRVDILGYEQLNNNSSIQVFSSGGSLVYRTNSLSQSNNINLSSKPAGLYLMQIVIGEEKSTWKIIKQ